MRQTRDTEAHHDDPETTLAPTRPAAGSEIEPEIVTLRTQLVSQGHTRVLLAETDRFDLPHPLLRPQGR